ncbi:hypothetical protein ACI2KR_30435 [Pseudomonas luteola]
MFNIDLEPEKSTVSFKVSFEGDGAIIHEASLDESKSLKDFSWSKTSPVKPGLYALIEPFSGSGVQNRSITKVDYHTDGQTLIYGGMRAVEHALPDTLWHRLSDLPSQE